MWKKVTKEKFNEIFKAFDGQWVMRGFCVDGELVGNMVAVDQDEDCYWFDYYVTEDIEKRFETINIGVE